MRLLLFFIFLLMTSTSNAQSSGREASDREMDSLYCPVGFATLNQPYLEFKFTGEKTIVDNQSLKGKVVLINFWFEGCHPCMVEMEAFRELFNKIKNNKDFVFVSVTKDNVEAIKRVKKKYQLNFEVFFADAGECQRLNFGCGFPTNIILDKNGVLKYHSMGGSIVKEEARQYIMTTLLSKIQSLF